MALRLRLPKVHFRNPTPDVGRALTRWKGAVIADAARYPPQRPSVRYRRTGTYGRNWRFGLARDSAEIFNEVPYARYLAGDKPVRWARAYGWQSIRAIAEPHTKRLQKDLGKRLRQTVIFG